MDPDGIMSELTLIHIILPSNEYWDLTSHSEGSPKRKLCIYPPSRIFSSEPHARPLWSRSTATLVWWFFWWVCGWHLSLMYPFKALSHCIYLTSVVLFIFFWKCCWDSAGLASQNCDLLCHAGKEGYLDAIGLIGSKTNSFRTGLCLHEGSPAVRIQTLLCTLKIMSWYSPVWSFCH